jgi:hypothetical protein
VDPSTGLDNARFEVLLEALLGIPVSWEAALCLWVNSSRQFEVSCCLLVQGRAVQGGTAIPRNVE